MVKVNDYPELKLICWNIHLSELTEDEAYGIYKVNWRYVYEDKLTSKEKELIEMLCEKFGEGVSLLKKHS